MSKYHYTYRITNTVEQKHYYGARSSKVHPSQDLGIKYFSSSTNKEFLDNQLSNPENFKYKVIKIFETREEAIALEIKLHSKFNVGVNESFYNKANQTSTGFDNTDKHLSGVKNKGYIVTKDVKGNIHRVLVQDERYLSGEFVSVSKNTAMLKDEAGNIYRVSCQDERYLSGEFVGVTNGMALVRDHNDNIFYVNKDDSRWISGEFVGVNKGKVVVKDKDGNTYQVSANDSRYLSGELTHQTKNLITVKDKDGNTCSVSNTDPRWLSGELVGINKNIIQSQETIMKRTISNTGKKRTEEQCAKISAGLKGIKRKEIQCPHCNKIGDSSNMKRWHFDNCNLKQDSVTKF